MVRTIVSSLIKGENRKYEVLRRFGEAVKTLNNLQTNAQTLEKIRQERDKNAHLNIPNMIQYAARAGINQDDIDGLNVIHVSGTKGKGSTCAFCESILRHHGYKTGFFSSPHLVEVRERFVVDGSPLDREKFASYFWDVYNKLDKTKSESEGKMPNYFGFLTVMALHVFLQEQVDVAIMEVGIGGQFDSTNIMRKPVVCGVTSLGLDHTSILGNTIDKIAWHKAGIFKPGIPAFTASQVPEAITVLSNRATELRAPLTLCPDMSVYEGSPPLGIKGRMQTVNASLALQLCHTWIKHRQEHKDLEEHSSVPQQTNLSADSTASIGLQKDLASPIALTTPYIKGLSECEWLGRNQKIKEEGLTFYLDGAHTLESVEQCVDWFKCEADIEKEELKDDVYKILIFNMTGDRDVEILLKPLQTCGFDAVLFCPNIAYEMTKNEDQTNKNVTKESQLKRCSIYKTAWEKLEQRLKSGKMDECKSADTNGHVAFGQGDPIPDKITKENACNLGSQTYTMAFQSISDCVTWVCKHSHTEQGKLLTENSCDIASENHTEHGKLLTENGPQNETASSDASSFELAEKSTDDLTNHSMNHVIKDAHLQVLVTGSLHLVGGALKVIWDRDLSDN